MNKLSPSQYTLTRLHVAALQGDVTTMRYLLMTDIRDLNRQDIHGWTPLHHAALTSGACVNALLKAGADSTIQNDMKGTPIDLCRMANAPEFAKEATISTTDATLSAEAFKLQTGATWVNDIYMSRMRQRELWSDPEKPKGLSKFNPAKNRPPHLVLKKDPGLEWHVIAGEKIPQGAVVALYAGERFKEAPQNRNYCLDEIDASHFRNYSAFFTDGFPNVEPKHTIYAGAVRTYFVAMKALEIGEVLCFDYATHSVKFGIPKPEPTPEEALSFRYIEISPQSATDYVKTCDLKTKKLSELHRIHYILNTPAVCFRLMLEGAINLDFFKKAAQNPLLKRTNFFEQPDAFPVHLLDLLMKVRTQYPVAYDAVETAIKLGLVQLTVNILRNFKFINGPKDLAEIRSLIESGKCVDAFKLLTEPYSR